VPDRARCDAPSGLSMGLLASCLPGCVFVSFCSALHTPRVVPVFRFDVAQFTYCTTEIMASSAFCVFIKTSLSTSSY